MTYYEFMAGQPSQFVPRETDFVEFNEPISEGIEVREHATLGEFLRELEGSHAS